MAVSVGALGAYHWLIIPFGLFLGLLGCRLYKISLVIIGLFLGLALGSWVGETVGNPTLGLVLGIIFGLALGVVTHFLIRFSFFLVGMVAGAMLAFLAQPYTSLVPESTEAILWTIGAAIAGGLVTLAVYRVLIQVVTSVIGTFMIYSATVQFFPDGTQSWSWILYVVLLAIFVIVQASARKSHPDQMKWDKDRRRR